MDPEPFTVLEPGDQEVRVLECVEPRGRVGIVEHTVAEAGSELAEDRRAQQEPARALVEGAENLVIQVVGDEPMLSTELAHCVMLILHAAEPQKRKVERSWPPLRSLPEHLDLIGLE